MTATHSDLPTAPFHRPSVLHIAPMLRKLQQDGPIAEIRTSVGDKAWMVTRMEEARALFSDPRLTWSHPDPDQAAKATNSALLDGAGNHEADDTLMRSMLSGSFSAKRMRLLTTRIGALVDELLTAMAAMTPPVNLTKALAEPLPVLVICELLGVPYADRERFLGWSEGIADRVDWDRSDTALNEMNDYMAGLLERKQAAPEPDVLSDLAAALGHGLRMQDATLIATGLLFAGHTTTLVAIEAGALHLLVNPDQRDALRENPSLLHSAVEEILRVGLSGGDSLARYAREDIEIGGVTIRAGDAVVLNPVAANHDPRAFADPDRFDIRRKPNPHVSFGHGRHMCIGMNLARVELRAVFGRLFDRFPTMRLAVPVDKLTLQDDVFSGGLAELPVAW